MKFQKVNKINKERFNHRLRVPGRRSPPLYQICPRKDQNLTSITLRENVNEEEGARRSNGLHIPRKNVSKTFDGQLLTLLANLIDSRLQ